MTTPPPPPTCSICFDPVPPDARVILHPCSHEFCSPCISAWNVTLLKQFKDLTCPTCRAKSRPKRSDFEEVIYQLEREHQARKMAYYTQRATVRQTFDKLRDNIHEQRDTRLFLLDNKLELERVEASIKRYRSLLEKTDTRTRQTVKTEIKTLIAIRKQCKHNCQTARARLTVLKGHKLKI